MSSLADTPKLLANTAAKAERHSRLHLPHIEPLTKFVEDLRTAKGADFQIPYFDSWDGGTNARILYLLEAPGAKAVRSGFISRNNPDETAKNFHELNAEAGIPRSQTVTWNIVPWYIGTGSRIRSADRRDLATGLPHLGSLLTLLSNLQAIVLIGLKAQRAASLIEKLRPDLTVFRSFHPSPLFVNNARGNRDRILGVMHDVRAFLDRTASA